METIKDYFSIRAGKSGGNRWRRVQRQRHSCAKLLTTFCFQWPRLSAKLSINLAVAPRKLSRLIFAFQTIESQSGVNDAASNSGADLLIQIRERNINFNKGGKHPYRQVNLNKQEVGKLFVKTIRLLGKLCTNQGVYATKVICAASGV